MYKPLGSHSRGMYYHQLHLQLSLLGKKLMVEGKGATLQRKVNLSISYDMRKPLGRYYSGFGHWSSLCRHYDKPHRDSPWSKHLFLESSSYEVGDVIHDDDAEKEVHNSNSKGRKRTRCAKRKRKNQFKMEVLDRAEAQLDQRAVVCNQCRWHKHSRP